MCGSKTVEAMNCRRIPEPNVSTKLLALARRDLIIDFGGDEANLRWVLIHVKGRFIMGVLIATICMTNTRKRS